MAKQQILDLKAKLEKAKEGARVAKAAMEASGQRFYNLGVQETNAHLTEELAAVCREYCQKVRAEALNLAGVLAASNWRRAENIYYHENLREAPATLLGPEADAAPVAIALE